MTFNNLLRYGYNTATILLLLGAITSTVHAADSVKLALGVNNKGELKFNKEKLAVKAGQKVSLVFTNSSPKDGGMQHNWVLTQPGKDGAVAQNGMSAGPDKGYLADSPDVLAHSKLLTPDQTEAIEFTAPAQAGNYPYICTFPGHYPSMKGVLTVQ